MKTLRNFCSLITGFLFLPALALGDVTGSGTGGNIPDNNLTGFTSTINFTQNELVSGNVRVTISGLTHSYVGDLIARLSAPNGTTVTLFNRIGRVNTGFGDSSNFNGTYSFLDTPVNSNGTNIWTEAAAGNNNYVLRSGQFRTTGANSSSPTTLSPAFVGLNTQGNWRLTLLDTDAADLGSFTGWSLSMSSATAVPESTLSALSLVFTALGTASIRRRRIRAS